MMIIDLFDELSIHHKQFYISSVILFSLKHYCGLINKGPVGQGSGEYGEHSQFI